MIEIIVFSYNRAMQLDILIKSLNMHLKFPHHISILYNHSDLHEKSYDLLKLEYQNERINFIKRNSFNSTNCMTLHYLNYPRNLYRYLKYDFLRHPADNFKVLLENLIQNVICDLIMFISDDSLFFSDFNISENIISKILSKPDKYSYRTYVGDNILGFPDEIKLEQDYYLWNYYDKKYNSHWAYPFSVDGTIYSRDFLNKILKNVLYDSPITLESFVLSYIKQKKYLKFGLSPKRSLMCTIVLNKVSTITNNYNLNIDVNYLNDMFLKGYKLEYLLPHDIISSSVIPEQVFIKNSNESILLYKTNKK